MFYVGYQVLFEVAGGGRTIGKRAAGMRVVMDGGAPVGLRASLIRNVVPLLEGLALMYFPAIDRDAGQQEQPAARGPGRGHARDPRGHGAAPDATAPPPQIPPAQYQSWDVTGVGDAERPPCGRSSTAAGGSRPGRAPRSPPSWPDKLRPRVPGVRSGLRRRAFLEHLDCRKVRAQSTRE